MARIQTRQIINEQYDISLHSGSTNDEIIRRCSMGSKTISWKCIADEIEARERQSQTSRGLRAQEEMAFWAKWFAIAAVAGSLAAFYSLWLLWRTWKETKRTANIQREIGEAQIRAYLNVAEARVCWRSRIPVESGGSIKGLQVQLRIDNTGYTPAKWYEISGTFRVTSTRSGKVLGGPYDVPTKRWDTMPGKSSITCPFTYGRGSTVLRKISKFQSVHFSIEGTVKYETEFHDEQKTKFEFFIDSVSVHTLVTSSSATRTTRMFRPPEEPTMSKKSEPPTVPRDC